MKKYLSFLLVALLMASATSSCKKDDPKDDETIVKTSLIAEITAIWGWDDNAKESWKYTYDNDKRITKIENYWEGELDKTLTYDYSTPGKLTITRDGLSTTEYEVDAEGRITKEYWNDAKTEWEAYKYNVSGFMTQLIEHWDGEDHIKWDFEIANENITKHTRYNDDGEVNRIKTFVYTIGDNVNYIDEANINSPWKTISGLYGKTSKKLVDYLEYWDGPGDEANVKKTTVSYEFDDKNRVSKATRAGGDWTEIFSYTYVD